MLLGGILYLRYIAIRKYSSLLYPNFTALISLCIPSLLKFVTTHMLFLYLIDRTKSGNVHQIFICKRRFLPCLYPTSWRLWWSTLYMSGKTLFPTAVMETPEKNLPGLCLLHCIFTSTLCGDCFFFFPFFPPSLLSSLSYTRQYLSARSVKIPLPQRLTERSGAQFGRTRRDSVQLVFSR